MLSFVLFFLLIFHYYFAGHRNITPLACLSITFYGEIPRDVIVLFCSTSFVCSYHFTSVSSIESSLFVYFLIVIIIIIIVVVVVVVVVRVENAIQLVRLFHQTHPDLPSSQYVAVNKLNGFEELWVSRVSLQESSSNIQGPHQRTFSLSVVSSLFKKMLLPFFSRRHFWMCMAC